MPTCIPIAYGVPALSGPPNWFDNSVATPQFWDQFDEHSDPRWRGAARKGFGAGAVEHLAFRALHSPVTSPPSGTPIAYLYLAWDIDVDASVDLAADGVQLGLQRSGGPAYVIKILAWETAGDKLSATATYTPTVRKLTGTSLGPNEPVPTWIPGTARAWLKNQTASVTTNKWAIHLRVPLIDSGDISNVGINLGPIGSPFKLWFDVDLIGPAGVTEYAYPAAAIIDIDPVTGQDLYPATTAWADATVGGTNCGLGVSLDGGSIGTTNPDPTEIRYQWPADADPTNNPVNQLFAKPKNTGPAILAHALKASFRTANWGTQPDWNAVPNPTTTLWTEVRPGVVKDNALGINAGVETSPGVFSPSEGTIQFPWQLSDTDAAQFEGPSATRRKHQCMYVELSGAGIEFLNDSAYHNMNFKAYASEFISEAEASVAGLEALAGSTHRDVFLFVDTRNMPETVARGEVAKPVPTPDVEPLPEPEPDDDDDEGGHDVERVEGELRISATYDGVSGAVAAPKVTPSYAELAQTAPTYMVHAYHDTGRRRRINGQLMKVLAPQTSFGYFVSHSGALAGWEHALTAPGIQQIADNYYRIRVPNGGSVPLRIRIRALSKPRPWWWRFWLLIRRFIRWIVATVRRLLGQ
jgi:hypothetical protein